MDGWVFSEVIQNFRTIFRHWSRQNVTLQRETRVITGNVVFQSLLELIMSGNLLAVKKTKRSALFCYQVQVENCMISISVLCFVVKILSFYDNCDEFMSLSNKLAYNTATSEMYRHSYVFPLFNSNGVNNNIKRRSIILMITAIFIHKLLNSCNCRPIICLRHERERLINQFNRVIVQVIMSCILDKYS